MSRTIYFSVFVLLAAVSTAWSAPPGETPAPGSPPFAAEPDAMPEPASPRTPRHERRTKRPADALQDRIDRAADALAVQGDRYWHTGRYADLAFCDRTIVTLDPGDVETWATLAWLEWAGLNDDKTAEKTYREGLALNRNRYDLYFELGNYLNHRKRFGEAADLLSHAVKFKAAPALVWNSYAHALEKMGRPEQARSVWEGMKTRFPGNVHTDVNIARMRRHGLIR